MGQGQSVTVPLAMPVSGNAVNSESSRLSNDVSAQDAIDHAGNVALNSAKARVGEVVVVSRKPEAPIDNGLYGELQQLISLKPSRPIIPSTAGYVTDPQYLSLPRMKSHAFTEMVLRYQFHLSECAEAVAFDENAIVKETKEVDQLCTRVLKEIYDQHRYIENIIAQIEKVTEVQGLLEKIDFNLRNTHYQLKRLNGLLPEDEQIEDPDCF